MLTAVVVVYVGRGTCVPAVGAGCPADDPDGSEAPGADPGRCESGVSGVG